MTSEAWPLEEIATVVENPKLSRDTNGREVLRCGCPAHGGQDRNCAIAYAGGKLLATCHSKGCAFEEIVAVLRERLGGEVRTRVKVGSRENTSSSSANGTGKTWELRDADGNLVALHVRQNTARGKTLKWKLPGGAWNLGGRSTNDLPLYGAEIVARAPVNVPVVLTEGEKAADALRAAGIMGVGTVTGAKGTPCTESLEVLRGRRVVLWPDNDGEGFKHMGRVAEGLADLAAELLWYEWPEAPEKGDAADHPEPKITELLAAPRWSRPPAIEGRMLLGRAILNSIDPPEELLPDILLAGKAHNIFAPGGVGKTWVLVWIATEVVKRGKKVVVFDIENGLRTYAERFEEMGGDPEKLDELLYYYPFPIFDKESYEKMLEEDKPELVMFDSWIGFLAADGRDENVSNDISAWADAYSKPALRRGIALAVLDHVPHEHERERGSTRKRDEMDVVWKLQKLGDFDRDKTAKLTMSLQKDREGWLPSKLGWRIGGDPATGRFVMERDDALAHNANIKILTTKERDVLDALEELGSARAEEWRRQGGDLSKTAFYRVVNALIEKNKVWKKDKTYHLVETLDVVVRSGPRTDVGPNGPDGSAEDGPFGPVGPKGPHRGKPPDHPGPSSAKDGPASGAGPEEPQDLGTHLRQVRDELRRQRGTSAD